MKEIIILDNVRNNVELFSENDDRCIYEFIKQVDPLKALMETEPYTVLTDELLTKECVGRCPTTLLHLPWFTDFSWRNMEEYIYYTYYPII